MLLTAEAAWLFTRGSQSVRIVRAAGPAGLTHLHVKGPDDAVDTREFMDVVACMNFEADLERRLIEEGFVLEHFTSDRRADELPFPRDPLQFSS